MTPDYWLERWQRGETGWHLPEINLHLRDWWPRLDLPAERLVFVPLCGKTLDLLWLASRGHRVLGVEISPLAVDEFFAEQGLTTEITDEPPFRRYRLDELTLLCGDFFALTPDHLLEVGAVYDRASLIALPPDLRPRYAQHLKTLMPDAASGLLITLDYDQNQMTGPPFAVHRDEIERLFGDRYAIRELATLDVLDDSPRFRQRGLTALTEQVWRLDPRGG
ncbi:thiopurine S-methyltransferase [Thiobaca trueperi]|uniref:Thiopurine S-methyltransferase n=1 Tax=Thiobaca trueperi TaxID=127458 RepID=A0A4R3N5Q1_9GAMM|nr:thiopurine S-methyltransferase [Thiobaca trueperi]TCT22139.1 thiopurine S-methyltransferase [Thiobaca trueperi]